MYAKKHKNPRTSSPPFDRSFVFRWLAGVALCAPLVLVTACGRKPEEAAAPPPPAAEAPGPAAVPAAVPLPRTPAPAGATVSIASPKNGDTVGTTFKVVLGVEGVTLAPAGDTTPGTAHHHLLVDAGLPADLNLPLPKDAQHVHLGQAQTEADLTLTPGTHTLQAVLGDLNHVPFDPPVVSETITVTVQ